MRILTVVFFVACCSVFVPEVARAIPVVEYGVPIVLTSQSPEAGLGDFFGDHVTSDGHQIFVGAPRENDGIDLDRGSVYVYELGADYPDGTDLIVRLRGAANPNAGDPVSLGTRFGAGIHVNGDHLFIGADNDRNFPDGLADPDWGRFVVSDEAQFRRFFPASDLPPPGLTPEFFFAGQIHYYRKNAGTGQWEWMQALWSDRPGSNGGFGGRTDASPIALVDGSLLVGECGSFAHDCRLHVFEETADPNSPWQRIQVLQAPDGGWSRFANAVVPLGGSLVLISEERFYRNGRRITATPARGVLSFAATSNVDLGRDVLARIYRVLPSGQLDPVPVETIEVDGTIRLAADCAMGGIDFKGRVLAISAPCFDGPGGELGAGAVRVYDFHHLSSPMANHEADLYQTTPGNIYLFGQNLGVGNQSVAVLDGLFRFAFAGAPIARFLNGPAVPAQPVDVYFEDSPGMWQSITTLDPEPGGSPVPMLGQSVRTFHLTMDVDPSPSIDEVTFEVLAVTQVNAFSADPAKVFLIIVSEL
jgi:hypothetical protein